MISKHDQAALDNVRAVVKHGPPYELPGVDLWRAAKIAVLLLDAFERSPYDLSPCMNCGEPVICLPDGLPCCEKCAEEST